jgi:simple sugar transport system substrate-binding protein
MRGGRAGERHGRKGLMALLALVSASRCHSTGDLQTPDGAAPTAVMKSCAGTDIVFFAGGALGDSLATIIYNGARDAERDLGPTVTYRFSNWDPALMLTQFDEAVAGKPHGIAIMGHPGSEAFRSRVQAAQAAGITVTSQNVNLGQLEDAGREKGFGYVGEDLAATGKKLVAGALARHPLAKGDRVLVWGQQGQTGTAARSQAMIEALTAAELLVDLKEITTAVAADPSVGVTTFINYVNAKPDVKMVFIDHGGMTAYTETYLRAVNKGPDDLYVVGVALSPNTAEAIHEGWVDLVHDEQPYLQGYLPILQICLSQKYRFTGLRIDTGVPTLVDKNNQAAILPLVALGIR